MTVFFSQTAVSFKSSDAWTAENKRQASCIEVKNFIKDYTSTNCFTIFMYIFHNQKNKLDK